MEHFKKLLRIQDRCVNRLYYCMDNNNIEGFEWYFEMWQDVTSEICNSKYNECGHKLSDDIMLYAYKNCESLFARYYDVERLKLLGF